MSTYPLAPSPSSPPAPKPRPYLPIGERSLRPKLADAPLWPTPEDSGGRSLLVFLVLVGMLGLYAWVLSTYNAGAHQGVDQNGYLMTARLLAGQQNVFAPRAPAPTPPHLPGTVDGPVPSAIQTDPRFDWLRNRLSFVPETPYQFAGRMCIITEPYGPPSPTAPAQYRVYAKYPLGYPLMAAAGLALGGFDGMYFVNPLCTVLACYFAYFLFRQAVSPFMSLLGVAWLACNPLVLTYSTDSNSHASTLFCVCIGFWGLVSWVRTRQNWRAWIGGLALGYACTIRYSEFLLVLPVLFAALLNLRFNAPRMRPVILLWGAIIAVTVELFLARWIFFGVDEAMHLHAQLFLISAAAAFLVALIATAILLRPTFSTLFGSLSLLCAWSIPIAVLAGVCWVCYGQPWKTGYTYCHESTGFAWKYLSGDLGHGLTRQGNWETLMTQLNHTGLFVLWPLAIAGIFAMAGSAWRLGTLIALWVLPPTGLYLLYYWAPPGETTVGYLRFFMSVMPGLIFAGLWVLDRGLVILRGERRPSLIAITLFGLAVWIAAALYFEDDALQLGPAAVGQIATALWHLASETWIGMGATSLILLLIAGIWLLDSDRAAEKTGIALGAGILTAIGCAVNLYNILPQVERNFSVSVGLRITVDNLRERVPRGAVLFCSDKSLNQIDALNNWKLINASLFTPAAFSNSKMRVLRGDKDAGDDPDPIQLERSRFYMELTGRQDPHNGDWNVRRDLQDDEFAIIDKNLAQGRRVMFLSENSDQSSSPMGSGQISVPNHAGYITKQSTFLWFTPPVATLPDVQNVARRRRNLPTAPTGQQSNQRGEPGRGIFTLYEVVRAAPAATKPTTKPAPAR